MRLSKKSAHRIIVSLGLIAPIVYLFGSLFFGLNGAHNSFPFSADYDLPVSSKRVDFNQLIDNGDFADSSDWSFSNCSYADNGIYSVSSTTFYATRPVRDLVTVGHKYFYSLKCYTNLSSVLIFNANAWLNYSVSSSQVVVNQVSTCNSPLLDFVVGTNSNNDLNGFISNIRLMFVDLTFMYGFGNEPSVDDFLVDFPNDYYPYTQSEIIYLHGYSVPDNSQYVFNQFFAKNNILEQWGENVLADNPVGFAPFATFIKFFDSSLIHGAGSQIALMMYGQLYYMLHIMLFDLVYHVLVFIPNLITGVFNKFGGGLNDE